MRNMPKRRRLYHRATRFSSHVGQVIPKQKYAEKNDNHIIDMLEMTIADVWLLLCIQGCTFLQGAQVCLYDQYML
ncbi:hypothetical protein Hanom_Chr04g00318851 [Helianthus anomalus]